MQIINAKKEYDAIIVGSGAGGGMAAFIMANSGMKIAVVEAGPFFDPKDPETMTQMKWPWEYVLWRLGSRRRTIYKTRRNRIFMVAF